MTVTLSDTLLHQHCPDAMPHEATAHQCEFVIYWYDVFDDYDDHRQVPYQWASPVESFTAQLPHCYNSRCTCTARAAEVLMSALPGSHYRERYRLARTNVNPILKGEGSAECQQHYRAMLGDFLDLMNRAEASAR